MLIVPLGPHLTGYISWGFNLRGPDQHILQYAYINTGQ